jgi:hypothetical protein
MRWQSAKGVSMTKQTLLGMVVFSSLLMAQPVPPAAVQAGTIAGNISQFNYGADGRVEGLLIEPNTLVNLPPDWGVQVEMLARTGSAVRVSGSLTTNGSGMQIVQPQSIEVAGKTLTLLPQSQPAPYAGSGTIRAMNYGPQGEINGFVLQNGLIARTPPFGSSGVSVIKPGASISMSGFARPTPSGRTVVEVQTITVNGQIIAMNSNPPAGPGPRPGLRVRGAAPLSPPPPPPSGDAPAPPPAPPPAR